VVTLGGAVMATVGTLKAFTARAAIDVRGMQAAVVGCQGSLGRFQQMNPLFG